MRQKWEEDSGPRGERVRDVWAGDEDAQKTNDDK